MKSLTPRACFLSLAALGCGGGGSADPDAASPGADAEVVGTCGVRIAPDSPRAVSTVVFNRPDGSVIGTAELDGESVASRDDCVDDTIITLARSQGAAPISYTLDSFAGIGRDTIISIDDFPFFGLGEVVATTNVAAPTADSYEVTNGCFTESNVPGSASDPLAINFRCIGRDFDTIDTVAIARNVEGQPISFNVAKDVPITAPTTTVDMSAVPWTPTGVSGQLATVLGYNAQIADFEVRVDQLVGGAPLLESEPPPTFDPLIDNTYNALVFPSSIREQTALISRVERINGALTYQVQVIESGFIEFDLDSHLPRIDLPVVVLANPERPRFVWLADGDISETTGFVLNGRWTGADSETTWNITGPGRMGTEASFIELPDELAEYRPDAASDHGATQFLFIFDDSSRTYEELLLDGTFAPQLALILGRLTVSFPEGDSILNLSAAGIGAVGLI